MAGGAAGRVGLGGCSRWGGEVEAWHHQCRCGDKGPLLSPFIPFRSLRSPGLLPCPGGAPEQSQAPPCQPQSPSSFAAGSGRGTRPGSESRAALRGYRQPSNSKESACHAGGQGLNPGSGGSPGEGNDDPLQYSCLENPMGRGAWRATVDGVIKSRIGSPPAPEAQPVSGSPAGLPVGLCLPAWVGIRRQVCVCVCGEAPCASARLRRAASGPVCVREAGREPGWTHHPPLAEPLCDSACVCVAVCPEPV